MKPENETARPSTKQSAPRKTDSLTVSPGRVAVNVAGAVLRLLVALASRVTRLLRCPRWAVRLTFALENARLKLESREKT